MIKVQGWIKKKTKKKTCKDNLMSNDEMSYDERGIWVLQQHKDRIMNVYKMRIE